MTDSISRTSHLVGLLREQLGKNASRSERTQAQDPGEKLSDLQVSELIALHVSRLQRTDPNRGRKAFRIFVEAVLVDHFGDCVVQDPKFHQLVDDVQREMENSPAIALMVRQAIEYLLSQPSDGN